jgi:twitching motility protein PilI
MLVTHTHAENQTLKDYQASILARLESAKQGDVAEGSRYLGVMVGQQYALVSMQAVKEAMSLLEVYPVPLAKPWLLGMANVRGALYGITDLAYFLHGQPSKATSSSRILLLSDEVHPHVGLLVGQLIGIRRLESMRVIETEALSDPNTVSEIEAQEDNGLEAEHHAEADYFSETVYEDMDQQRWRMFDLDKLLNTKAFMQPA